VDDASVARNSPGLIPAHGGYQKLKSYQMAEIVHDATVRFCERFIDRRSRTHDQMVQAARSGKQNIAEGSQVSGTSKKTELNLVNIARGSLEELLVDYKDFLRQRGLALWDKGHPTAQAVRRLAFAVDRSYLTYKSYVESAPPEVAANALICLVHQTNYLLDQQLRQLEQAFLRDGGFTERLYRTRQQARALPPRPDWPHASQAAQPPPPNKPPSIPRPAEPPHPRPPANAPPMPNSSRPSHPSYGSYPSYPKPGTRPSTPPRKP
jgi:four helix bundle suffix protein